jgi:hypothetical protein
LAEAFLFNSELTNDGHSMKNDHNGPVESQTGPELCEIEHITPCDRAMFAPNFSEVDAR